MDIDVAVYPTQKSKGLIDVSKTLNADKFQLTLQKFNTVDGSSLPQEVHIISMMDLQNYRSSLIAQRDSIISALANTDQLIADMNSANKNTGKGA